jgi:hypothetical protein
MTSSSTAPEADAGNAGLLAGRSAAPVGESRPAANGPAADLVVAGHFLICEAISELAAVVEVTETAANRIIDACDTLSALGRTIGSPAGDQIMRAVTTILEACEFQDLTGQRVRKAIKSLRLAGMGVGGVAAGRSANAGSQGLKKPIDQSVADRVFAQSS